MSVNMTLYGLNISKKFNHERMENIKAILSKDESEQSVTYCHCICLMCLQKQVLKVQNKLFVWSQILSYLFADKIKIRVHMVKFIFVALIASQV